MKLLLQDELFELLPEKALYNAATRTLILADLHLGKAAHFRKNGIAIPAQSAEKDYRRLDTLIRTFQPQEVIFLGDLFHSAHNSEWPLFADVIGNYSNVSFMLIMGNHDILHEKYYMETGFTVVKDQLERNYIIYSHQPLAHVPDDMLNIAGHIHPGYTLVGKGLQHIRLSCFYHYENSFILPAFGSLTGLYIMQPSAKAKVYLVLKDKVIKL
jgi:DNA ligase-associated metallophosphoesterase